jgi:hypothetical protein
LWPSETYETYSRGLAESNALIPYSKVMIMSTEVGGHKYPIVLEESTKQKRQFKEKGEVYTCQASSLQLLSWAELALALTAPVNP